MAECSQGGKFNNLPREIFTEKNERIIIAYLTNTLFNSLRSYNLKTKKLINELLVNRRLQSFQMLTGYQKQKKNQQSFKGGHA